MRSILFALLLASASAPFAQPANTIDDTRLDALAALARTYGVVRYFHPSDSLDQVSWDRFLVHACDRMGSVSDPAQIAPRLEELFGPVVEGFRVGAPGGAIEAAKGEGALVEWRHLGYGLEAGSDRSAPLYVSWRTHHDPLHNRKANGGYFQNLARAQASVNDQPVMRLRLTPDLEAQIAVSLPMSATKVGAPQQARLDQLAKTLEASSGAGDAVSRAQAHADGIALWNVARHFYPYWAVVKIDWEGVLRKWLAAQPQRQSRAQHVESLRRLAAPMGDGQASIHDPRDTAAKQFLPVSLRPAGDQWVVDESRIARVRIGDVLVAVDGKPMAQWYADRAALESGSEQHKRWRVRDELLRGAKDALVKLRFMRGGQPIEAVLAYESPTPIGAARPPAIHELKPGIYYVDVRRFSKAGFDSSLPALRDARGIVFDLRGYPSGDAAALASYWITGTDGAQWMRIPRFDKPFAEPTSGWTLGWQRERDAALEKPAKVLLTDGRAISFAESLAGYFPGQKTGLIVGESTAGANGNTASATLPGGMKFTFTGMVVTRHDGAIYHGEGFKPDITVIPTPAGIQAGRDEVLERAVATLENAAPR